MHIELLKNLESYFRNQLPKFEYKSNQRDNCIIFFSKNFNQILCIKYAARKHYISEGLAWRYLERSRNEMRRVCGQNLYSTAYILNILIGDNLTKSCFNLSSINKKGNYRNIDMVFCTKFIFEDKIASIITRALSQKFEMWSRSIKSSLHSKNMKEPFGVVKDKLEDLNLLAETLKWSSYQKESQARKKGEW